jgi:hypothetical protein
VPEASRPAEPFAVGGVFASSSAALSFLGAVAGSGLSSEAACRHSVDGRSWWAETDGPPERVAQFVWTAGGKPYVGRRNRWMPVPPTGAIPDKQARPPETLDLSRWKQIDLAGILADFPLRPARYLPGPEVQVIAPGPLSRWILRRASALDIDVRLAVVTGTPLGRDAPESSVILHWLSARRGNISPSLVNSLASLPSTTVATAFDGGGGQLLVDVHHRTPLEYSLLAGMIPEGEVWVFGAPDVGHCRFAAPDKPIDGATLLDSPTMPSIEAPAQPGLAKLPAPLPVRLVPQPGGSGRVDAVLLDDRELHWLATFLSGHPAGDQAFLLPGSGCHLLVSAGGIPGAIPFGIPLAHELPGGLYIELGMGFAPPLPEGARAKAFGTGEGRVVAITAQGAFRFDLAHLVPAWTLWVGETPQVTSGLSARSQQLLDGISRDIRIAEGERVSRLPAFLRPLFPRQRPASDKSRLLEEALRAEQSGDFVRAAELLEAAGERGRAGRLYERAAKQATA